MSGADDTAPGPPSEGEVNVVLTLRFKPGSADAVLDGVLPLVDATRREPGNSGFDVFKVTAKPDTLVIIERWRNRTALEEHWALPTTKEVLDLFQEHLAEPLTDGANVLYLTDMTS